MGPQSYYYAFLIYGILPSFLGFGAYLMKSFLDRIDAIEKTLPSKVTDQQVRQLLSDKIDPIREDISELKDKIDTLMSVLLNKH